MNDEQDRIFRETEADHFFERNRAFLEKKHYASEDLPLRIMEMYNLRPGSVLEIGAATGYRLAAIHELYGRDIRAVAIDASEKAVAEGKRLFPDVEFCCCPATDIPYQEPFEMVIVHSVFHWLGRRSLLTALAEADRLLQDNGFLILADFFPSHFVKTRYHHVDTAEVFTFKQNYAAIFLATGLYEEICCLNRGHTSFGLKADAEEQDRFAAWLLRKTLDRNYLLQTLGGHE